MCAMEYEQVLEGNFQESDPSFSHVGPGIKFKAPLPTDPSRWLNSAVFFILKFYV